MDYNNRIEDSLKQIASNISYIMATRGVTQKTIERKCKGAGLKVSQSTISNARNGKGNITLTTLLAIAYALDVNVVELLDKPFNNDNTDTGKDISDNQEYKQESLISNPDSSFTKKYLGKFHILFYRTSSQGEQLVRGTLQINRDPEHNKLRAFLILQTGEIDIDTKRPQEKVYEGDFYVSYPMKSIYIYLVNHSIGEACMLIGQHLYTTNALVETTMAVAVTNASGINRRPTVHRVCMSREPATGEALEYIKGQLLMNTSEIFITQDQINTFCEREDIPISFKKALKSANGKKLCNCISEESLYDSSLSDVEKYKLLSLLRTYSEAPKYNKISSFTDEAVYSIMQENLRTPKSS